MKKVKRINMLRYALLVIGNIIMCAIALFAMWGLPKIGFSAKQSMIIGLCAIITFGRLSYGGIEAILKKLIMNVLFDETELCLKKHNIDCELELNSREEDGVVIFEHDFNFNTQETPDVAAIQELIEKDLAPICDQINRILRIESTYTVFVPNENVSE